MRLCIKNIARLKSAEVRLDGITVIAGENNSGKSTVGQVLFAVLNSAGDETSSRALNEEFNGNVLNFMNEEDGFIMLEDNDSRLMLAVNDDEVRVLGGGPVSNINAVYIDDPHVLDASRDIKGLEKIFPYHRMKLLGLLTNNMVACDNEELRYIMKLTEGRLVNKNGSFCYQMSNGKKIDIRNVSSGVKMFLCLYRLIENGTVDRNSFIVLDEPEIHLHPEWQLKLVEIIVMLVRKYGVRVLLNTHSPYMINAIEVYTMKEDITDRTSYYLAANEDKGSVITDETESIESIYKKLAEPLQYLEDEAYGH